MTAMPEAAPPIALRKSVVSAEGSATSIQLQLLVSDYDSVAELLQKTEGRERDEYAYTALKIGLLALKQARGQIDADAVRHEGERLLYNLKSALDESRNQTQTNLANALKEYFDPESGRFAERVERLIKHDGELENVLRRQVGNDGSEMVKTLSAYVGENSPLMRLLNPTESDGLISSIRTTISAVVNEDQTRILQEFSLDNEKGALRRLVTELTIANTNLKNDVASEIGNIVEEFSLDKEDSALSRLVRRVEVAEQTITKEFSLDDDDSALSRLSTVITGAKNAIDANLTLDSDGSALSRLKRELVTILEAHQDKANVFQTNVQAALEAMKAQRKKSARSTQHGRDFEVIACEVVERETQRFGDIAIRTGLTTGLIKNCKVGDLVIELGADCSAAGETFVVEAKQDASYTIAKARVEIDTARKNRGASVGLFLFSAKTAPEGMDALVRHGEDVFLVWDSEKVESDVILRAGISLAKAMCVRRQRERNAQEGDWDHTDDAILTVERETTRLANIKTWTETIQSNSGKVLDEVRKMSACLELQIGILRESVAALKQE